MLGKNPLLIKSPKDLVYTVADFTHRLCVSSEKDEVENDRGKRGVRWVCVWEASGRRQVTERM